MQQQLIKQCLNILLSIFKVKHKQEFSPKNLAQRFHAWCFIDIYPSILPIIDHRNRQTLEKMDKTAPHKTGKKLGRPTKKEAKKNDEKLKETAHRLFLEKGYDAVTMDQIAAEAGITKRTLYAKYNNKGALFSAVLKNLRFKWPQYEASVNIHEKRSLRSKLNRAATALMNQALDPETIKIARIASTNADRLPGKMQEELDMALDPRVHAVANILRAHKNEIKPRYMRNPDRTAELFVGLIIGVPMRLASFGTFRSEDFEKERIKTAISLFIDGLVIPKA